LDERYAEFSDVDVDDHIDSYAEEFLNRGDSVAVGPFTFPVPVPVLNGAVNANDATMKSILSCRRVEILVVSSKGDISYCIRPFQSFQVTG
jgi:hypothetical protein